MVNFGKKLAIDHRDQMKLLSSIFGKKLKYFAGFQAFRIEISALIIPDSAHQQFKIHKTNFQKIEGVIAPFLFCQNKPEKPKIIARLRKA